MYMQQISDLGIEDHYIVLLHITVRAGAESRNEDGELNVSTGLWMRSLMAKLSLRSIFLGFILSYQSV